MNSLVTSSVVQAALLPLMTVLGLTDIWAAIAVVFAVLAAVFFLAWAFGALRRRGLKRELADATDYAAALETLTNMHPVAVDDPAYRSMQAAAPTLDPAVAAWMTQQYYAQTGGLGGGSVVENAAPAAAAPVENEVLGAHSLRNLESANQNLTQTVHQVIKANVTGSFAPVPESSQAAASAPVAEGETEPVISDDAHRAMMSGRIPRL